MLTNLLLRDLIRLFDYSNAEISSGDGEHAQGIPAWTLNRFGLTQSQLDYWFTRVGYADHCFTWFYDEEVDVEVEVDDVTGGYFYRSPENYKIHTISEDDIAIYAPNTDLILHTVADLLDIPMAFRNGINKPSVHDVLWNLGKMRIGRVDIDVWIAKEFSSSKREVYHYLERPELPELGILLTCGGPISEFTRRPMRFEIVRLYDIIPENREPAVIQVASIKRMFGAPDESQTNDKPLLYFDPMEKALHIHTRAVAPWRLSGTKQIAIVEYLATEHAKGVTRVPHRNIMLSVYGSAEAAKGKKIGNIFNGNDVWRDYICNDKFGYGIRVNDS